MTDVRARDGEVTPDLVGRAVELRLLRAFLAQAAGQGDALLLSGGPGVGKSVLLDHACQMAGVSASTVLRAAGVQFEAEVSFAGLNQLFLPLQDRLETLPPEQCEALSAALGTGTGPTSRPLVVPAAALTLLRDAAQLGPVLVVVDDAHWLDGPSARVLGFIARRVAGSRIGLLAAVRDEGDRFLLHAGLPTHEVPPLDGAATKQLLDSRFPGLADHVRQRVMSAARGNPLAILELPASLTEDQRRALAPLPPVLPLNEQLQRLFVPRVLDLPAETRRLLLLTALDGTGDLRALRADSSADDWFDGLAPAERSRLVRVDTSADRVEFRHPLIGAAVVELATSGERRRAHAVLAELFPDDPERRAWHLSEAVLGPDEQAAGLLEIAAERALRKGDAVRAVRALLRAADLSPRGADRARRLAGAAYVGADTAGRLSSVPELLGAARRADPDNGASLEATVAAAYHLLNGEGDVGTAHHMLVRSVQHALQQGLRGRAVEEALHCLMVVCHFSGRDDPWQPFEAALAELGDDVPPVLSVSAQLYAAPLHASVADLDRLEALIATLPEEVDPTRIVRVAAAAFYVDRLEACRSPLWRVVTDGRGGGAAASAVNALMMLAHDAYSEGRWDAAARTAADGIAWSEELGYRLIALPGVYCHALLAAARGEAETTRRLTDDLTTWAAPRGAKVFGHFAARARALSALGGREFEEAYRLLSGISPAGRLVSHVPVAMRVAGDLVEAAVRTGRLEEAKAHVAEMERAEIFGLQPRLAMIRAGAAALVAPADEAGERYRNALSLAGGDHFPFEHARVQLAYGEHLRRSRSTSAARVQLTEALDTFRRLAARPWATRAEQELRASGLTVRAPWASDGVSRLTPQEYEIASLAASGLSNKQIASRLYVSPRTVSGHLYRIFPKLGISTRAALRDALSRTLPPAAGER